MRRDEAIVKESERLAWLGSQHDRLVFQQGARWADEHPDQRWISVNEQYPDEGKTILGWFRNADGTHTMAVVRRQGTRFYAVRIDERGMALRTYVTYTGIRYWQPVSDVEEEIK